MFAVICAVTAVPAAGSRAEHRAASCTFASAQHELAINSTDLKVVLSIRREGQELVVTQGAARIGCGATAPTVANVDTVSVSARTEFRVDLGGGPLAPGFTDEGDGSSEIEIDADFGRAGGFRVMGSRRKDKIFMGDRNGSHAINLNGRERRRDADVTVDGGYPALSVISRGGNDVISGRGGPGFSGPLSWQTTISSGAGRDRVKGASKRDLIGGGDGADRIAPGKGIDRIRSQGGADRLRLRDGTRDFAQCGAGEDRLKADRKDRVVGCDTR